MGKQVNVMDLLVNTTIRLSTLEKYVDLIIAKNHKSLILPTQTELNALQKSAQLDFSKEYPNDTNFIL